MKFYWIHGYKWEGRNNDNRYFLRLDIVCGCDCRFELFVIVQLSFSRDIDKPYIQFQHVMITLLNKRQRQPFRGVLRKSCFKIRSKFTGEQFRHGCSSVNLLHILRIPFSKNTSEGLLLKTKTRSNFVAYTRGVLRALSNTYDGTFAKITAEIVELFWRKAPS